MSHIAAYGDLSVAVEYENIIYVWGDCGFDQHITTPFRTRFSSIHEPFAYYSRVMHKPLTVNIYDDEEELNILDSLEAAFDNPVCFILFFRMHCLALYIKTTKYV